MGFIGRFAKAILLLTAACWIFLILEFVAMGQSAVALFLFLGFLIPLSVIVYERWKTRRNPNN
ncbi:MAG: hypothetical protein QW468_05595 [Candidatus Bathyarchaeia archaeon]